MATLVTVIGASPSLNSETDFATLTVPRTCPPKTTVVGATPPVTIPPTPVSAMRCDVVGALSTMVMAPVRVPVAEGVKITLMVQLPFGEMDVQLLVLDERVRESPVWLSCTLDAYVIAPRLSPIWIDSI